MMILTGSCAIILIFLFSCPKYSLQGNNERRLLDSLLNKYNTLERPVANESDPLQLSFGITLMQIIDVEWNDVNLAWNESEFANITNVRIPPSRIWKPDVLMYNSADEGFDGTYPTNVVVTSNGSCNYIPPGIFKSNCKIDITWFPFDEQRCEMKFGSWTYNGFQVDLQLQSEDGGDVSSFIENGEWTLIGVPGVRTAVFYTCCPEPYVDITFVIHIQRRTIYYFFNLIVPCILIASMSLIGFTLPPESGEKLSLGITILLSLTVFLNMIAESMPATSDAVPLLGTYFNCIMFMVAASVVSTILILNYHHRSGDTHEMSSVVRTLFLQWLPWLLKMSRPGERITLKDLAGGGGSDPIQDQIQELEGRMKSSKSLLVNVLDINDDFRASNHRPVQDCRMSGPDRSGFGEITLIRKELKKITDWMRREEEGQDLMSEWRFAAMVLDRLCLIVSTLFTIVATIAVVCSAPTPMIS